MGNPHHKNKISKERISLYLSEEMLEEMRQVAAAHERSLSGQINWVLANYLNEQRHEV